jgi:ribose transport system permease protein
MSSGAVSPPAGGPITPVPEPAAARSTNHALRHNLSRFSILGIWALLFVLFAVLEPDTFLQVGTFKTIFGSQQALVFLTLGLLCPLIVGEFDLSVASILGLAATLVVVLHVRTGLPIGLACALALLACVFVGCINGFLAVNVGVDPIVVTLGMGTLLSGVALWVADLQAINGLSPGFSKIALTEVGGLPISFYYGIALALVFAYVLAFTPLGRHMTFVGASREVARLAGVGVRRIRFGSYVMSALLCGAGGVILAASLGGYDPTTSQTYLLPTFAAAFLGTAVIQPGRFNPIGAMVGIYFLATGIVGLQLLGYTGWVEDVFYGGGLVAAVAISTIVRRRATS